MTGRAVYDRALSLINERDSEGAFHGDTADFEKNAPELINLILAQVWADDMCVRGIPPKSWRYAFETVRGLDEELPLHGAVASIIPYLAASLLIHEEDMTRSEYYRRMFESARANLLSSFKSARHTSITDVYR